MKECVECKQVRKIQAKGLCFSCYDRKTRNPKRREQRRLSENKRRAANPIKTKAKQAEYKATRPWSQRVLFNNNSWRAKDRRENLSQEFLEALQKTTPNCKCCGCTLVFDYSKAAKRPINLATLDRVNSNVGYSPSNVAIICLKCNSRKRDMSIVDLQMIIDYIKKGASQEP